MSGDDVCIREGENCVSASSGTDGALVVVVCLRVMLKGHGGRGGYHDSRDRGLSGSREVRELGVLLRLVGADHRRLLRNRLHVVHGGSDRGVVGGQLVVRHRWAGVDTVGVRGWGELFVLERQRGGHVEKLRAGIVHESSIWGHCR